MGLNKHRPGGCGALAAEFQGNAARPHEQTLFHSVSPFFPVSGAHQITIIPSA
jgi:hypothetical protein